MYLDVAGRELRGLCFLTLYDLAFDSYHELSADVLRLSMGGIRRLLIENDLCQTIAVSQIDEREWAKVALLRDPAHQHDLAAFVAQPQLAGRVRPLKIS